MKQVIIFLLTLSALFSGRAEKPKPHVNWKKILGADIRVKGTKVISGNELEIAGIRCRLFGVQIPEQSKDAAKRFMELYLASGENCFIYNEDDPIDDKDGVPLIWVRGGGNDGWAQENLVQAGLGNVSYLEFDTYKFHVSVKVGNNNEVPWKQILEKAAADFKAGAKPRVRFKWPESK